MSMKALELNNIASGVFAPIYPVLARQIAERTGVSRGICLDIGGGEGCLSMALIQNTELKVILYDLSPDALKIAEKRIRERGLKRRMKTKAGDVHQMPFPDNTFNLIVSHGSFWSWKDPRKAFGEIIRVLVPGGKAYIGGGFGTEELKRQIVETMNWREPGWEEKVKSRQSRHTVESVAATLDQLGIDNCRVIDDQSGLWVSFAKNSRACRKRGPIPGSKFRKRRRHVRDAV